MNLILYRMNQDPEYQDQPEEDEEQIEDISEKDEAEGRSSLDKYTTGPQRVEEPPVEKEASLKGSCVVDAVGNYARSAGLSMSCQGKKLCQDTYYCGMQEFVDATLKAIASKIAEKKALEMENSGLKIALNKMKEDIMKEKQMQKAIQRTIEQEVEVTKKREQDNEDLSELLAVLQEKTKARKDDINAKLAEADEYYTQLRDNLTEERAKFEAIKEQIDSERKNARAEIKNLEIAHVEAAGSIDDMKRRIEHNKIAEYERVKMLRQKSKMLATLIGQETLTGKSPLHKDISKILRSPLKQSSVMQSMSRSYGKV